MTRGIFDGLIFDQAVFDHGTQAIFDPAVFDSAIFDTGQVPVPSRRGGRRRSVSPVPAQPKLRPVDDDESFWWWL